jgi:hypothetical protein
MSENNKTENLQATDVTEESVAQEDVEDTAAEESADTVQEESASVFSKGSENALGGAEYIGSFDDLLKSLGMTPISQMDADEIFADDGFEEINLNVKQEDGYVPFSDETYLQSAKREAKDKQSKKFMQNFRVLSRKTEDSTLLEAAPTGDGKGNVADRVKIEDGEDIFEAV